MSKSYAPPFTITPAIVRLVTEIGVQLGRISVQAENASTLRLRRINRIRTIQGSLAIEGRELVPRELVPGLHL